MTTKKQVRVPKGWYIVRNRTRIHRGDRFMSSDGVTWMGTSDWGRKIKHGGIPSYEGLSQYAGIYIRRLPARRGKGRK